MPHWVRSLVTIAAATVPTFLTLAALGALGFWGWSNGWRLSPSRPVELSTAKQASAGPAVNVLAAAPSSGAGANGPSSPGPARIEFSSPSAVDKVGIQVAPVRVRALTRTVTAPGMVDYDPGRYARLTSRA
jgi:hypothetical protein